uniref:Ycf80 n=1 Tax=Dasya binghamiae TaxID=1896963 RepID=A0A1C8XS96_9FLOR|nr:hypothetical protein BI108_pgp038 [Dasya binghamiae]AOH77369.1 hypothetical protein [Dasya binghamiae]
MLLLNKISENTYQHLNHFDYSTLTFQNKKKIINYDRFNKNKIRLILNAKLYKNLHQSSSKLLHDYIDYKFISRNFWNKFINQYWQETIFISLSNPLSDNYINKLKNKGLLIHKGNDYKNFLIEFSKDLINGKIQVLLNQNNNEKINISLFIKNNNTYIKYIWRKGIYWHIYYIYSKYLLMKNNLSNRSFIFDLKNIVSNSLPIFTVTNQYNKLIMAESAEQILLKKDFLQTLDYWYNSVLLNNRSLKKIYTGLLFINPEDALEYKEYIAFKYIKSNNINYPKFFIGKLNLYSRLFNCSSCDKEFRLIPDLKEVSDLIYKYQYNKNIIFDKYQKYGKNHFQGQPIYIINSIVVKNINTNAKEKVDYFYSVSKNSKIIKYKAIFLNYKTAIVAWNKFREEYSHYKLPQYPLLYVSNLETFLKTSDTKKNNNNSIFIPSTKTYLFIKKYKQTNKQDDIRNILTNKSISIKSFLERVIWSLTSRQPTNW